MSRLFFAPAGTDPDDADGWTEVSGVGTIQYDMTPILDAHADDFVYRAALSMTLHGEFGVAVDRAQAKVIARIFGVPLWAVWRGGPPPLAVDGREYTRRRKARKRRR